MKPNHHRFAYLLNFATFGASRTEAKLAIKRLRDSMENAEYDLF